VALVDEGLLEPLPMATRTSHAYAQSRLSGGTTQAAYAKARTEWTRFEGGGEADDPVHRLVWGLEAPLDRLIEGTRFDDIALRLWEQLCRAETTDQL
jgi:exodeoxyribonuclease V gamma subunit